MELTIQDTFNYAEDASNRGFIESMVETRVLAEAYICDIDELVPLIENYVSDEILEIVEMTKENLESNVHQFATYLEEGIIKGDRNSVHISEMKSEKARESYSKTMNMSKAGVYDQLTSEYGEKFTAEAAQYAIDNMEANWKENALKKAESYSKTMNMSKAGVYDQLTSEHGEKFTAEEAQYAIDNLE